MSIITTIPEIGGLKARLKETWMAGNYDLFSRYMEQDARAFYERLDVPAGCQLLDVACGSGQLALWAARDGIKVTGVDIAPNLVQRAQVRANAEGLNARFMEGDAEALPFEDASFDVVTKCTIGYKFVYFNRYSLSLQVISFIQSSFKLFSCVVCLYSFVRSASSQECNHHKRT